MAYEYALVAPVPVSEASVASLVHDDALSGSMNRFAPGRVDAICNGVLAAPEHHWLWNVLRFRSCSDARLVSVPTITFWPMMTALTDQSRSAQESPENSGMPAGSARPLLPMGASENGISCPT